jgi:hypothetical protein
MQTLSAQAPIVQRNGALETTECFIHDLQEEASSGIAGQSVYYSEIEAILALAWLSRV